MDDDATADDVAVEELAVAVVAVLTTFVLVVVFPLTTVVSSAQHLDRGLPMIWKAQAWDEV